MITLDKNPLVWGVVGNLGGGKTLSAVSIAVEEIVRGRFIVSNVTLDVDRIATTRRAPWVRNLYSHIDIDAPDFNPFLIPVGDPRGSSGERRVVVILDEIAEWFDQYQSAKTPRVSQFLSWLRHSSKRSQDVIIICQRQEYILKPLRSLIARWIWVDDLAVYRLPYLKIKFPFCSDLVMQKVFDRQNHILGRPHFVKKSVYGRYYNTAECLNALGASTCYAYNLPPKKYHVSRLTFLLWVSTIYFLFRHGF